MVFENIYQLQRQLTDKYVVVDQSRPELQRFGGMTGQVKTVNFSGRALVEFDANNNIGWFDIDPQFLKVIDAPLPKPVAKEAKAEKKAAPAKAEKPPAEKLAEKPAAKPAAAAPKPGASVADILAAARGGAKPAAQSTADILAAARSKPAEATSAPKAEEKSVPAASETPAKVDPKKLSVADMLAMARGQKPAGGAVPAAPAKPAPAAKSLEEPVAEEPVAIEEAPAEVEEAPAAAAGKADRSKMSVADMLAYCRKVDVK